ncbi:hypothetical protein ACX3VG_23970, partial [Escherichia coli]
MSLAKDNIWKLLAPLVVMGVMSVSYTHLRAHETR